MYHGTSKWTHRARVEIARFQTFEKYLGKIASSALLHANLDRVQRMPDNNLSKEKTPLGYKREGERERRCRKKLPLVAQFMRGCMSLRIWCAVRSKREMTPFREQARILATAKAFSKKKVLFTLSNATHRPTHNILECRGRCCAALSRHRLENFRGPIFGHD